ncbi:MAG: hypothetical protein Q8P67_02640 [archaeon]|nr:hypothetical protein [archaeon]
MSVRGCHETKSISPSGHFPSQTFFSMAFVFFAGLFLFDELSLFLFGSMMDVVLVFFDE